MGKQGKEESGRKKRIREGIFSILTYGSHKLNVIDRLLGDLSIKLYGDTAAYRVSGSGCSMRLFGKHVFPRQIAMVASG
jgi:hypothetical protein